METALVFAIEGAGPFDAVRRESMPADVAAGIPIHVTLRAVRGEIERVVAPNLPHRCQARDVSLLEEFVRGRWCERERLPLGG